MSEYLGDFVSEAKESLEAIATSIEVLRSDAANADAIAQVRRLFHSLKSAAAMMQQMDISALCKEMELQAASFDEGKGPMSAEAISALSDAQKKVAGMVQQIRVS